MSLTIRKAVAKDMEAVLSLITELAVFENEPNAVKITADTLRDFGTGANALFHCFIAEEGEEILGIALVYFRFSTWAGKSLHLEDLIVAQNQRGKGVGKALYNQVMLFAKEQDAQRVEWVVLDWNKDAIRFYENSGALILKDWYLVQMDKTRLENYISKIS